MKLIKIALVFLFCAKIILCGSNKQEKVPEWVSRLKIYIKENKVKAFLDTISFAEGTFCDNGYKILYGYQVCKNYADHPRQVISSTSNNKILRSSAAGRYQILEKTYNQFAKVLKIKDFSPLNQDLLALAIIRDMGALTDVRVGKFKSAIKQLNPVWSSLPGAKFKQRIVPFKTLQKFYLERLKYYKKFGRYSLGKKY